MGYKSRRVVTFTLEGLRPRFETKHSSATGFNLYVRVRSNITMFFLYVYSTTAAVYPYDGTAVIVKMDVLFYRHSMKKRAPHYVLLHTSTHFSIRRVDLFNVKGTRKTCHCGGVGIKDVSFVVLFLRPQAARSIFVLHDGEAYSYYSCTVVQYW